MMGRFYYKMRMTLSRMKADSSSSAIIVGLVAMTVSYAERPYRIGIAVSVPARDQKYRTRR